MTGVWPHYIITFFPTSQQLAGSKILYGNLAAGSTKNKIKMVRFVGLIALVCKGDLGHLAWSKRILGLGYPSVGVHVTHMHGERTVFLASVVRKWDTLLKWDTCPVDWWNKNVVVASPWLLAFFINIGHEIVTQVFLDRKDYETSHKRDRKIDVEKKKSFY